MDKVITCINCPVGCRMTVTLSDDGSFVSVTGNTCPRGSKYAVQECTCPTRTVTAVIPVNGISLPLSVKTSVPVPKNRIREIMEALGKIRVNPPVQIGDILAADLLGTGADIVATRNIPAGFP